LLILYIAPSIDLPLKSLLMLQHVFLRKHDVSEISGQITEELEFRRTITVEGIGQFAEDVLM
jgi:hypothetical protein